MHAVLCPMNIEYRAIARAVRNARLPEDMVSVVQTGIGAHAIERTLGSLSTNSGAIQGVILAGVCGGLRHTSEVPRLACVLNRRGRRWPIGRDGWAVKIDHPSEPGVDRTNQKELGASLVGVDDLVPGPNEKRDLADQTGADLVDMESHTFAAHCERLGLRWAVVRGVSDRPGDVLPTELLGWITTAGDTRPVRAVTDMLRRPSLIPHTVAAVRRSSRVLKLVGERVVELILGLEQRCGP